MRDHPVVWVTWRTKPEIDLDALALAPRSQLMLRYTATGSDMRNDMKITMQNFATERINRGGNRMAPVGVRMVGRARPRGGFGRAAAGVKGYGGGSPC